MLRFLQHQEVELDAFRFQIRDTNIYEDIIFENGKIEKEISKWLLYLKVYKSIEIKKFSQIFSVWNEIVLPVKLKEDVLSYSRSEFIVIDSEYKEFYMGLHKGNHDINCYFIGRRDKRGREFVYKIIEDNRIVLTESYLTFVDEEGKNKDGCISIDYDIHEKIAVAKIRKEGSVLEVKYYAKDTRIDDKVMEYLAGIYEENYSESVLPVVKGFIGILDKKEELICVESKEFTKKGQFSNTVKICSKICVEDGEIFDCTPRKIEI